MHEEIIAKELKEKTKIPYMRRKFNYGESIK